MLKRCECGCGETFEAARRSARFASAACRQRASRAQRTRGPKPVASVVQLPTVPSRLAAPTSVSAAVESGDEIAMHHALLARITKAIDDPNCPPRDLAALQRAAREIRREITALELAAKQEAAEEVPEDVPIDAASI
ncbi:MAG: hypothetical protein QM708_12115 [Propioniciclava sp.]|uniref:hypothetical protein n=1 Tax=Propioniciclava sp. TaxID=2038686 RepID=UPI0039E511B0